MLIFNIIISKITIMKLIMIISKEDKNNNNNNNNNKDNKYGETMTKNK